MQRKIPTYPSRILKYCKYWNTQWRLKLKIIHVAETNNKIYHNTKKLQISKILRKLGHHDKKKYKIRKILRKWGPHNKT